MKFGLDFYVMVDHCTEEAEKRFFAFSSSSLYVILHRVEVLHEKLKLVPRDCNFSRDLATQRRFFLEDPDEPKESFSFRIVGDVHKVDGIVLSVVQASCEVGP